MLRGENDQAGERTQKQDVARLLKFSERGHTLYFSSGQGYSNCHCSGYEDPESFGRPYHWHADPDGVQRTHFEGYEIPAEGIAVLDLREATKTSVGVSWVFKGPMVNVDLADGAVDELPEVSPMMAEACAGNAYGALLAIHKAAPAKVRGSLDSVSVPEYVEGWREHGARLGRFTVTDGIGQIEWETQS